MSRGNSCFECQTNLTVAIRPAVFKTMSRAPQRLCVIGAGMGGLAAAALLAARGLEVIVLERGAMVGGKARFVPAAQGITMRDVFAGIFDAAGASMPALTPTDPLGRHLWPDGAALDLHADPARNADAIGAFAGAAAARGYLAYAARARHVFEVLAEPFIFAQRPSAMALMANPAVSLRLGRAALGTLWDGLAPHFPVMRLRQVFARAAAQIGCSPLLAPATLMMVHHIENQGVWRVEGGFSGLAEALATAARAHGAVIRCGADVARITVQGGRARGVVLRDGETLAADAVLLNADAMGAALFGPEAARAVPRAAPSFSAITWRLRADSTLPTQTALLPDEPTAEFTELHYRGRLPTAPSIQIARDGDTLHAMVNAPARAVAADAVAACGRHVQARLAALGIAAEPDTPTTPADFAAACPGTQGALYGAALHGWQAAFQRPAARSALPGLFICGGGAHPGAGIAMAAQSGRLAAHAILEDRS